MSDPEQWLAFARQDAQIADLAMQEGIFNQVCFHSQQCVEKSLKALIVHQGQTPPRIHKLTDLLALVSAVPLSAMASEIYLLDRFYTVTRYPGFSPLTSQTLPDQHDAEEALDIARKVLDIVTNIVTS
ncbi:HEPN domain-containing protein [Roseiflexus sp.]|uniref:HEPN domain-containing protein n=1 Tax=Roseiflexus sp. TaxID=2562120 RepID=UPI0021DECF84|nr:HEPN domain-containing protein [Roseiflexus sp.]GIW02877.1 MAG: nucleotidyltransferase [Roseiflexus sp.]